MSNLEKAYEVIDELTTKKVSGELSPELDDQIEKAWSQFWTVYEIESNEDGLDAGLPGDVTKKLLEMVERSFI